jgi:hypothetical protein
LDILTYLQGVEEARRARRLLIEETEIDDALFDDEGDDPRVSRNPIHRELSGDIRAFVLATGFSPVDFSVLYEPLDPVLSVRHRGREPVIGPLDSFLLFLHWLRTGSSFEKIGTGFRIAPETLRKRTLEVAAAVHRPWWRGSSPRRPSPPHRAGGVPVLRAGRRCDGAGPRPAGWDV